MDTSTFDPRLAEIVCAGAAMLDDVTDAVRHCRTDADPSSELARACGSLTSRYLALLRRAQVMPRSGLQRRVSELLNYHMELTAQASMLAFRPHDEHWPALAKGFGDGPGRPTRELRHLADQVCAAGTQPETGAGDDISECAVCRRRTQRPAGPGDPGLPGGSTPPTTTDPPCAIDTPARSAPTFARPGSAQSGTG